MKNEIKHNEKIDLYFTEAQKIIPQVRFSSAGYNGNTPINIEMSTQFGLIDSLFNKVKTNSFIHYTSIPALIEIFNAGNLRMFNCHNLNDPYEIEHGLNLFGLTLSTHEINIFKRNHFVFSACEYEENRDDFNMWRFYGDSGKGAGIVFEIEYGDEDYKNSGVHIGKVQYGENNESIDLLKKYFTFHSEFDKEHHLFQSSLPNLFPLICSFFKNEIWQIEKEIRIVANCKMIDNYTADDVIFGNNFNTHLKETLKTTLNKKSELVSYLELPIKAIENPKSTELCPKIVIKKIVLGYDVSETMKASVVSLVKRIGMNKFGYDIGYSDSKYKKIPSFTQ